MGKQMCEIRPKTRQFYSFRLQRPIGGEVHNKASYEWREDAFGCSQSSLRDCRGAEERRPPALLGECCLGGSAIPLQLADLRRAPGSSKRLLCQGLRVCEGGGSGISRYVIWSGPSSVRAGVPKRLPFCNLMYDKEK
ncbi:hypothetical protein E2320_011424 [Naja naja]|nr:hypothetical protein E2320_011424 [Naja naja]